jgi:hypothetical protein
MSEMSFKEDVNYRVTTFDQENISIVKQHHLSKNGETHLVDDTHGININLKKAKVYELQDLFKLNAMEHLNKIILENVAKQSNNSLNESQLNACKVKPEETTSFSIEETKKDGLKITFHLTEKVPANLKSAGYVKIRMEDLKEYINPSGPLEAIQKRLANKKK